MMIKDLALVSVMSLLIMVIAVLFGIIIHQQEVINSHDQTESSCTSTTRIVEKCTLAKTTVNVLPRNSSEEIE